MFVELNKHSIESSRVGENTTHQIQLSKDIINTYLLLRKKEILKKKNENARTMMPKLGPTHELDASIVIILVILIISN